jgi:hypothetical protein
MVHWSFGEGVELGRVNRRGGVAVSRIPSGEMETGLRKYCRNEGHEVANSLYGTE